MNRAEESHTAARAALFCLGLVLGSFYNVVIYRLPRKMSLVKPGSSCPHCGHRLGAG
ncbi:MAG: prepilin peptidase, partial [Limnochordia bacterium]